MLYAVGTIHNFNNPATGWWDIVTDVSEFSGDIESGRIRIYKEGTEEECLERMRELNPDYVGFN